MLATPTPTTALALWIAEPAVPPRRGTVPEWRSPRRRCMRWTRLCRCCCADGAVQVGWSPRRAVLVRPPRGLTSAGLATLLQTMHSPIPMSELERQADRHGGVAAGELGGLVAQLVAAGVATRGHRPRPVRSASIRVHGRGPLSELLVESLRCSGARVKQSSQPHAAVTSAEADLVVLSDNLVADPRMLRDLHSQGVAHLAVRVRDGIGLVGPLVIPGVTSCLDNS